MNKYFYYDKKQAENGIKKCVWISDTKLTEEEIEKINVNNNNLLEDVVIHKGENPLEGYPVIDGENLRKATDRELIELGIAELEEGETLEGDNAVKIERPSYQYDWDYELLKWIPNENLMYDGQYIENGEIITVPNEENFLIPVWNKELHVWEESATEIDFLEEEYRQYLALNTPLDFIDMEAEGVLTDYKTYMKEARVYLKRTREGVSLLAEIPQPSQKLEKYFKEREGKYES